MLTLKVEQLDHNNESADFSPLISIENRSASLTTPTAGVGDASPRHPSDVLKPHRCEYANCDKSFNRPAKLAQHMRSHTNTRLFPCPHAPCTKDFLRDSHLKHHVKSAHTTIRDYSCEWVGCDKSFITATRLRRHIAAHEGKEKFRCHIPGCVQTFRKHGTLQKHITIVHEGRDPFVCQALDDGGVECGAGFDTEGKLRSHVARIHGSKRFLCVICTTRKDEVEAVTSRYGPEPLFSTHAELTAHIRKEHPPTCDVCGLKCASQSALKNHLEVIHGGLSIDDRKTHVCPKAGCGRGFTKKGNLNTHIRIDHDGKRFVCGEIDDKTLNKVGNWDGLDACGEACKSKANLEKHIRSKHLGTMPSGKASRKTVNTSVESTRKVGDSVLLRLTGAGYEEVSSRRIPCLVYECDHRFRRQYDLEVHLQSKHGLEGFDVQELLEQTDPGLPASDECAIGSVERDYMTPEMDESLWSNRFDAMGESRLMPVDAGASGNIHNEGSPHQIMYASKWALNNDVYPQQLMYQKYNRGYTVLVDPSLS